MEDLEREIKKQLQQRQIQPSANAWERMEQLLNVDKPVKQKPIKLYYVLSAAASVLLFVGLWIVFQKENQVQFPETKPTEQFVISKPKDLAPIKEEQNSALTQDKELIVTNNKWLKKVHLTNKVPAEIVQNNKNQPQENNVDEFVQTYHIVQKSNNEIEEKLMVHQSKIEIKVNPHKLLQSAEMERQTDNMVSNGQNFWKKVKEINTVVAQSK